MASRKLSTSNLKKIKNTLASYVEETLGYLSPDDMLTTCALTTTITLGKSEVFCAATVTLKYHDGYGMTQRECTEYWNIFNDPTQK